MYNLKFLFPCNFISSHDLENGTVPIPSLNILLYKSSLWEFHKSYGCNETSLELSRTISEECVMERTLIYFMQFFYLKEAVLIWWRLITCRWDFHYEKRLSHRYYSVSALFQNWSREQILLNCFLFYIEHIHIPHKRMWWKRHWHIYTAHLSK